MVARMSIVSKRHPSSMCNFLRTQSKGVDLRVRYCFQLSDSFWQRTMLQKQSAPSFREGADSLPGAQTETTNHERAPARRRRRLRMTMVRFRFISFTLSSEDFPVKMAFVQPQRKRPPGSGLRPKNASRDTGVWAITAEIREICKRRQHLRQYRASTPILHPL